MIPSNYILISLKTLRLQRFHSDMDDQPGEYVYVSIAADKYDFVMGNRVNIVQGSSSGYGGNNGGYGGQNGSNSDKGACISNSRSPQKSATNSFNPTSNIKHTYSEDTMNNSMLYFNSTISNYTTNVGMRNDEMNRSKNTNNSNSYINIENSTNCVMANRVTSSSSSSSSHFRRSKKVGFEVVKMWTCCFNTDENHPGCAARPHLCQVK